MAKTVETTDELVRKAAEQSPVAKETLKTLFPSVFKDSVKAGDIVSCTERNGTYLVLGGGLSNFAVTAGYVRVTDGVNTWIFKEGSLRIISKLVGAENGF